jgi:hypothetical protein
MTNETMTKDFWPDGVRLVISISMQFEAGGQPPKGPCQDNLMAGERRRG